MTQPASLDDQTFRRCDELPASPILARLGTASAATLQPHLVLLGWGLPVDQRLRRIYIDRTFR